MELEVVAAGLQGFRTPSGAGRVRSRVWNWAWATQAKAKAWDGWEVAITCPKDREAWLRSLHPLRQPGKK